MKDTKPRMDLCGLTAGGELSGQISRASKKMRMHDKICGRHMDNSSEDRKWGTPGHDPHG